MPINLASEPFRRDRPILAASAAVVLLMTASLAMLLYLAAAERDRASESRQVISKMETQLRTIAAEQTRIETVLRQPRNAAVLDLSQFLNALLQRKAVSWTRIFGDLESVMPHNVRLISIRPQISAQNELLLDMMVGSQAGEPVLDLLMKLEGSPLFGTTTVHNSLPPSQADPLFRYRVSVRYAQKL